jgi:hypothetical protein
MWLAVVLILAIVFMVIAGILSGGIFTIVLVPLAGIAAVTGLAYAMWARATGAGSQQEAEVTADSVPDPLPHSEHSNAPAAPDTPGQLVDARRRQQ